MIAPPYDYKKDFHFVIVGTVKGESKEVALEILKTMTKNKEEIKEISEFHVFGRTLISFFNFNNNDLKYLNANIY
jgi:hypothetical protein